ncbi:DUF6497 family protein [Aliisedimentitalea scapharcae]|uniref:DUF6497 family protein n=1 Tax=Aliisedimentitalea scapharcae TaxID=1524259 RepID=A0ABZ2XRX9_9RHOB
MSVLVFAGMAAAADIAVPSGQTVTLNEVLLDKAPGELWVRFRFVAPQIARDGGSVASDQVGPDMDHLCESLALPYLTHHNIDAARVVISFSDQVVPFGTKNPAATQYFEAYQPDPAGCIWEEF